MKRFTQKFASVAAIGIAIAALAIVLGIREKPFLAFLLLAPLAFIATDILVSQWLRQIDQPEGLSGLIAAIKIGIIKRGEDTRDNHKLEEVAVSIAYLNQLKQQTARARAYLIISTTLLFALTVASPVRPLYPLIFSIPLVLYVLLVTKEAVLQYRITLGLFGTDEYEARAMIAFLLENAQSTDFTDGTGKLKPVFLPEKRDHAAPKTAEGVGAT
jgi:hypothetical protein